MEDPTPSDLAEQIEEIREENERLRERVEDLEEENQELAEENEELRERVEDLEERATVEWDSDDVADLWVKSTEGTRIPLGNMVESSVSETVFESKLEDLRDRLADGDLADESESGPAVETETPLEDAVALPDNIAESELNPNQYRARFLVSDITNYAGKTTSGWAIRAGEIKRVMAAAFDAGHDETVRRVIEFMDQLGDDTVTVNKRNGEKRVLIDERAAKRLSRLGELETHVSVSEIPA